MAESYETLQNLIRYLNRREAELRMIGHWEAQRQAEGVRARRRVVEEFTAEVYPALRVGVRRE